jgi:hypothetical protein
LVGFVFWDSDFL